MPDRYALIARKQEVRRAIEQVQRRIEAERAKMPAVNQRKLDPLERRLEQLMAEEASLRIAIDQSKER
jgi:hypothetical protein